MNAIDTAMLDRWQSEERDLRNQLRIALEWTWISRQHAKGARAANLDEREADLWWEARRYLRRAKACKAALAAMGAP